MKLPPIVTHKKLEELRDKLKEKGIEKFSEFKKIRYALFRMQTFLEGGASPEPEHLKIAKELEKEVEELGGIKSFAINWDLHPITQKVIRRDMSVWKAHENFMDKAATQLVEDEDGNLVSPTTPKKSKKK